MHAYLHRKAGDASNAAYWYRRAGRAIASGPLADEWIQLRALCCGARACDNPSTTGRSVVSVTSVRRFRTRGNTLKVVGNRPAEALF
jgi:hypothetical protein